MYRKSNPLLDIIAGIVLYFWLGQGLLYILDIKNPSGMAGIAAGTFVFAGLFGIGIVYGYIAKVRERWKRCPHSILGGISQGLCKACADEKQASEANYRRQRAQEEQQRRVITSASELRNSELVRLTRTILPSLDELRELTPQRFEDEIALMFKRLGYTVRQTPYSNDAGKDALLWKDGQKLLLECKRYGSDKQSGRPELQKFHSAIISENAKKGFFVTTGRFSAGAIKFAKSAKIELICGDILVRYLLDSKPEVSKDDRYYSKCLQCGDLVQHRLRTPEILQCRNNHPVNPALKSRKPFRSWAIYCANLSEVFGANALD